MTGFEALVSRLTAIGRRRPERVVPDLVERSRGSRLLVQLAIQKVFAEPWGSRYPAQSEQPSASGE